MDLSIYKFDKDDWTWFSNALSEIGSEALKDFHDKVFTKLKSMPVKSALTIPEICKEKNLPLFIKMAGWYISDYRSDEDGYFWNKSYTVLYKYTRR